jgi:hypothetical protein
VIRDWLAVTNSPRLRDVNVGQEQLGLTFGLEAALVAL